MLKECRYIPKPETDRLILRQLLPEAQGVRFRPNDCVNPAKHQWDC